ncbi:Hypothetical protein PMT_2303 [Prochlorococcus marinus str. MIT 9313]|uniref:Uncharacterized protein n=1 Tax=Prochlorococcus marinus (strain MIT 9313) TaxID=74547 RepID=B9ERD7_PROMM|nr:Hypothetical protein PMT_2303 [Prochlorococcus marinus str. MIT 9313]
MIISLKIQSHHYADLERLEVATTSTAMPLDSPATTTTPSAAAAAAAAAAASIAGPLQS